MYEALPGRIFFVLLRAFTSRAYKDLSECQ